MIFNESVFKNLLKEAYKGAGLLVANKEGRIVLAGDWWVITMEEKVFSNKGRAALVELTGQLPVQGECWRATSGGNQMEVPPEYIDIDGVVLDEVTSYKPFEKTAVTLDGLYCGMARLYQRDRAVVCINESANMLLDTSKATEYEDILIKGPYTHKLENPTTFYWYTDECSFAAKRLDLEKPEYQQLFNALEANVTLPVAKC